MKSLVFLGNKEIGYKTLEYLIDNSSSLGLDISACMTADKMLGETDCSITGLCRDAGINTIVSLDELIGLPKVDIIISVQFHQILKKEHIEKARQIAVNLHMAPLPDYRGCNQFSFAILDRAKEFGTSLHRIEQSVDAGALMFEKRFKVPDNCFVSELYKLTFEHSLKLFKERIWNIINGNYELIPQDALLTKRTTSFHYRKEIEKIKNIDMKWDKEKIMRHFRATYFPPFPNPYYLKDGKRVFLDMEWYNRFK